MAQEHSSLPWPCSSQHLVPQQLSGCCPHGDNSTTHLLWWMLGFLKGIPLFFFFFFLRDSPHFSISQGYERSPRWADIPTCHPLKCISSHRCFHHLWFWGCYISSAYWQSLLERSQNLPHEFPQTTLKRQAGMKGEERKLLLESEPLNCAGWTARSLQNRSSWKKKTSTQSTECCLQYFCAMKCCSQIPWSWEDDAMCTSASAHHFTERH